ncbi:hypothetical protein PRIPAC_75429 [Pristionchus pacificus]|uniref:Uncharacterized protein n=1 Tax=Pristionchus pacificus TaxID=54126 RepID=A0A2A6CRE0_PRIPA|nr:hypothetical protein PRIPAC_75429 [Pristionchus pacificus]|eukprot:PDM80709.1 hypothetical protein PRIPAC_35712 [Pristionchus pacificus]
MKRAQSSPENNSKRAKNGKVASTKHLVKVEPGSLNKVTVFETQAELKRQFTVTLESGLNEVTLERISNSLIDDSVRVTGTGDAVIEEVKIADRRVWIGAGDSERAAKLRTEKEELEKKKRIFDIENSSLSKRIQALDAMIGQVGAGIAAPKSTKFSADEATLESVTTFFDFYDRQATEVREKLSLNEEASAKNKNEIIVKEGELKSIQHGHEIKIVTIMLDSAKGGKVDLELSYQVSDASWDALYDVRVGSRESKTEMQLSYFANVYQRTGEDWEGAQLILSTAHPSLGGKIPDLNTLEAVIVDNFAPQRRQRRWRSRSRSRERCRKDSSSGDDELGENALTNREASVNKHTLSTEFVIARPCSIPSDDSDHKVTIGIITLEPQLVHVTVPSKNACAFLTASAVNSSSLPLFHGDASIYLDGAFVAKTKIQAVFPGEPFTISLGIDPSVKIDYSPAHKYGEQSALVNKWSTTVIEQKIAVRNTRDDAIMLTVRQQIPRSTDERIKVKLIFPSVVEKVNDEQGLNDDEIPKERVRLLPSNNLEWTVNMDKGKTQTLLIKYSVEHLARRLREKVEFVERRE